MGAGAQTYCKSAPLARMSASESTAPGPPIYLATGPGAPPTSPIEERDDNGGRENRLNGGAGLARAAEGSSEVSGLNGNGKARPAVAMAMDRASEDLAERVPRPRRDRQLRGFLRPAWPSVAMIARRARVGERTVKRATRALAEAGELEIGPRDSGRQTNSYVVAAAANQATEPTGATLDGPSPADTPGAKSETTGAKSDTTGAIHSGPQRPIEDQVEDQISSGLLKMEMETDSSPSEKR